MPHKLILGLIAVLVVVLALAGFFYGVARNRAPELESATLSWGEFTEESTAVDADLEVKNDLPFGLDASSITLDIPVYFYDVEAARFNLQHLKLPRGQSTLLANATLNETNLPQWWDDFLEQGEQLHVRIQPQVKAQVLGMSLSHHLPEVETDINIPIMSNLGSPQPIKMGFDDAPLWEIVSNPSDHFMASPPDPQRPIVTMESWELSWGEVTEETTEILGTIVLTNELLVPLLLQGLQLELDMNGISVVKDINIAPTQPSLPPHESVPLKLGAEVDNSKFTQWWTSHLQRSEKTTLTARIGVTLVLPTNSGFGLTAPLPLPLVPVPAFEARLSTNIMGIANYKIAEALGKPLADKPKAVEVQFSTQRALWGDIDAEADVESIETAPSPTSLKTGQTQQFTATATYSDGSRQDITSMAVWSSSDTYVASITQDGLASAVSSGSTTITATLGSVKGSALLTVSWF